MRYTETEREEARYETWVICGGRQRHQENHQFLAEASLKSTIVQAGWRVLEHDLIDNHWNEIRLVEAVVRRGNTVKIIRWNSFNKGWMEQSSGGGWVIFRP